MPVLISGTGSAFADDTQTLAGVSASVDIGHYRTDFAYPGGNYQADVNYYGMTFVQPVSESVGFGLLAGYQTTGMNNPSLNTLADGYGPFAGLYFDWRPELNDYWNLDMHAGYTWHDMSYTSNNQQPNQQADLTWYTSYFGIGPLLHYGPWRLGLGGYYQNISGTETDSGSINQKLDFSAVRSTGGYIGFMYYMNNSQSLGMYALGGAVRGVSLIFRVEFQ
ncbi:MAG: hypothetical protein KGK44_01745 [Gammaproteobacteria bacterium]|nr:hypothetical protein [Gammaproteobacteria bacterium]